MKIGIIGVGNVGQALAKASVRAGHTVTISATNPEKAQRVAAEVGGSAASSNRDAVADADAVILAVPFDAVILAVPFDAVNTIVNELVPSLTVKS
jgi:8-hydroxy-5-deazaflavin:NADPH oxidoreductase